MSNTRFRLSDLRLLLQVKVAKRPRNRTHNLPNRARIPHKPHIQHILKRRYSRNRLVRPRDMPIPATIHLRLREPRGRVEKLPVWKDSSVGGLEAMGFSFLPDRPHAVHHAVVHPEGRVAGGGVQVSARVAADGVVDAAVRADFDRVRDAFGEQAVLGDVRLAEQVCALSVFLQIRFREGQNGLSTVE